MTHHHTDLHATLQNPPLPFAIPRTCRESTMSCSQPLQHTKTTKTPQNTKIHRNPAKVTWCAEKCPDCLLWDFPGNWLQQHGPAADTLVI